GTGMACTASSPCSLDQSVSGASAGDEVIVGAGDYSLTSTLNVTTSAIDVHGAAGAERPTITSSASTALRVSNSGASVSDLNLVDAATAGSSVLFAEEGTVERLFVSSTGETACPSSAPGATIRDSVCWDSSTTGEAGLDVDAGTSSATLTARNVTAISLNGAGIVIDTVGAGDATLNATNIIAGGGNDDVFTLRGGGGSVLGSFDHSNYATVDTVNGGTVTSAGSGSNQTAAPLLVNPAAGDFRELAGSPTIDTGVTSALNPAGWP
ncbi:MAG: hypothetical protein WBQ41_10355, partial [Solirubrobacterales bacterium]